MDHKPASDFLDSLDSNSNRALGRMKSKLPWLADSLVNSLYGEVYQRDKLTLRERFFVTIAALITSGSMQPQLAYQTELALKNGVTRDELLEVACQISPFFGYATAINAMAIIDSIAEAKPPKR